MKLLALDTSTEACSAALFVGNDVNELYELAPRAHGTLILSMVDRLLAEAELRVGQLDAIAFGRGPGAFTGVRIATGVVQGIAFGADLPVVPVSSLAALAQGAYRRDQHEAICAAIDARMNEVYWAAFKVKDGLVYPCAEERVCPPEQVPRLQGGGRWFGAGSGWATYGEVLETGYFDVLAGFDGACFPHAQDVGRLALSEMVRGEYVSAERAMPVYLRDQVVRVAVGK